MSQRHLERDVPNSPSALARVREAFGDPGALSGTVCLVYLPFGAVGPLVVDPARLGGSPWDWLPVALAGQFTLMAIIGVGALVRRYWTAAQRAAWWTISVLFAAVLVRALVLSLLPVVLGLNFDLELPYRVGTAVVTQLMLVLFIAYGVGVFNLHRRDAGALEARLAEISLINAALRVRLDEVRRQTSVQVHSIVDPLLVELDRLLDGGGGGSVTETLRQALRTVVDKDLRPLSHRLDAGIGVELDPVPLSHDGSLPRVPLPTRMPIGELVLPVITALVVLGLATSQAVRGLEGPGLVLFPVVSAVLVFVLLGAVRVFLGTWSPRLWLGILTSAVACALVFVVVIELQTWIDSPVPSVLVLPAALFGLFVGAVVALGMAVGARRVITEQQLLDAVMESERVATLLRRETFVAQRQLGYVLHGAVQSALHASALRIGREGSLDEGLVAEVRQDILAAMTRLETPGFEAFDLEDVVSDIAELWANVCRVVWFISEEALEALAATRIATVSTLEILRELVANAVKHGGASQVDVEVVCNRGVIHITVIDNGCGEPTFVQSGLGSRMLDEMCMTWTRTRTADGTIVRAQLAL